MSLNKIIMEGKIISDLKLSGSEGNECLNFIFGFTKNYKTKDQQYPDSISIPAKAFGKTATFINTYFKNQSHIIIVAALDRNEEYQRSDGTIKPAEYYLNISEVCFAGDKSTADNVGTATANTSSKTPLRSATKTAVSNPSPFGQSALSSSSSGPLAPKLKSGIGGR